MKGLYIVKGFYLFAVAFIAIILGSSLGLLIWSFLFPEVADIFGSLNSIRFTTLIWSLIAGLSLRQILEMYPKGQFLKHPAAYCLLWISIGLLGASYYQPKELPEWAQTHLELKKE